jgi:hypothetical protein
MVKYQKAYIYTLIGLMITSAISSQIFNRNPLLTLCIVGYLLVIIFYIICYGSILAMIAILDRIEAYLV